MRSTTAYDTGAGAAAAALGPGERVMCPGSAGPARACTGSAHETGKVNPLQMPVCTRGDLRGRCVPAIGFAAVLRMS
jgi:hypothetical protein